MTVYENERFVGERALFSSQDITVRGSVFEDGESPLKESRNVRVENSSFGWKYPLWYCRGVVVENTLLKATARSGIWYTHGIEMTGCVIDAPKTFRRSSGIRLKDVTMLSAQETLWSCSDIRLEGVTVRGDYFGMNCEDVYAEGLTVCGNYLFDGTRRVTVKNSTLISKDAFWNCEDVEVYDSVIVGEYLGWNSKRVRLVRCKIESNQGMCYMEDLTLDACELTKTDLAFEYSTVDADIISSVDSVKNPTGGRIVADSIGEIIMEPERVDVSATEIKERVTHE